MADNGQENTEKGKISANTQIVFTLKGFIGTILTILGLFVGFHKMVIVPNLEGYEEKLEKMDEKYDKKFETITDKLIEVSNGVGNINGNIEGINNRLKDLHNVKTSNQSGSFD